jgi:hypothetical protein
MGNFEINSEQNPLRSFNRLFFGASLAAIAVMEAGLARFLFDLAAFLCKANIRSLYLGVYYREHLQGFRHENRLQNSSILAFYVQPSVPV